MEVENGDIEINPTQVFLQQVQDSVTYIKALNNQKKEIIQFLTDLKNDSQLLSLETYSEIDKQLKWFQYFFNDFQEDEDLIIKNHISLKDNIFNGYSNYIKDLKSNLFSLLNNDLKYLPNIQTSQQPQYDSLQLSVAISQLLLYIYFFFLNKHSQIYLTSDMFTDKSQLIDIVSISHLDYIIYIFEGIQENQEYDDGEFDEDQFKIQINDLEQEIEQFDNFLQSIQLISDMDEKLVSYIPKFEHLYGFFLAKQQTVQMCKQEFSQAPNQKRIHFENIFSEVVDKCLNPSIPNNNLFEKKSYNMNYMHPYISLIHLTFNQFINPSSESKQTFNNNLSQNFVFYDKIYKILLDSINKVFQNSSYATTDVNNNNKNQANRANPQPTPQNAQPSNKSKSLIKPKKGDEKTKTNLVELQKCLNFIQETIIITPTAETLFRQLAEQVFISMN